MKYKTKQITYMIAYLYHQVGPKWVDGLAVDTGLRGARIAVRKTSDKWVADDYDTGFRIVSDESKLCCIESAVYLISRNGARYAKAQRAAMKQLRSMPEFRDALKKQ